MERLSWSQAVDFCKKVSEKSGKTVRLPTEAEWEYACRAGTTTPFAFGDSDKDLDDYAWIKRNSNDNTFPVCSKKPNSWGLYDMHGNVLQWCSDWLVQPYPPGDTVDPQGPDTGKFRVIRGGCYSDPAPYSRCAFRRWEPPEHTSPGVGFRIVVEAEVASFNSVSTRPVSKAEIGRSTLNAELPTRRSPRLDVESLRIEF